uniref:Flocculation protein FLO11-like n=1 Tax=Cucumis melo TaxID=3656 RepID=A0A9I9CUY8_CUCME
MDSSSPKTTPHARSRHCKSILLCCPFKRVYRLDDIKDSTSTNPTQSPHAGMASRHATLATINIEVPTVSLPRFSQPSVSSFVPDSMISIETVILDSELDSFDGDDSVVLSKLLNWFKRVDPSGHSFIPSSSTKGMPPPASISINPIIQTTVASPRVAPSVTK